MHAVSKPVDYLIEFWVWVCHPCELQPDPISDQNLRLFLSYSDLGGSPLGGSEITEPP